MWNEFLRPMAAETEHHLFIFEDIQRIAVTPTHSTVNQNNDQLLSVVSSLGHLGIPFRFNDFTKNSKNFEQMFSNSQIVYFNLYINIAYKK